MFEPFIDSCLDLASEAGVSEWCEFRHGNILKLAGQLEPADVAVFAAFGDEVVEEAVEAAPGEPSESELILARAVRLADEHPEAGAALIGFAEDQAAENGYIDANLVGAVWVLQRA